MRGQEKVIEELARAYACLVKADQMGEDDIKENAILIMRVLLWYLEKVEETGIDKLEVKQNV